MPGHKGYKMRIKTLFFFSLIALLSGCMATPYQPLGFRGGYSETRLNTHLYEVVFNGNGYTSPSQIADFAMLRASEVCLNEGSNFFYFGRSDRIDTQISQGPTTTVGQNYGNNFTSTQYGGPTVAYKPSSQGVVACSPKDNPAFPYNARIIMNSIKTKYGLK